MDKMKKVLFLVMTFIVLFSGVVVAGEKQSGNKGEHTGATFRGDFDFMLSKDDPRFGELKKLREEFKETIKNKPVDKTKQRIDSTEGRKELREKVQEKREKIQEKREEMQEKREERQKKREERQKERREERQKKREERREKREKKTK